MTHVVSSSQEDPRLPYRSWMYSILLHGILAASVASAIAGLSPPREQESFQWNVSLVESMSAQPMDTPSEVDPPSTQPAPVPQPVQHTVPQPHTIQPVPPPDVPSINQTASTLFPQPIISPPFEPLEQTEPIPTRDVLAQRNLPVQEEPSQPTLLTTPEPTPQPVTDSQPVAAPLPQEAKPAEVVTTAVPSPASISAHPTATSKTDYGWLMKALLGRINELKSYPHLARINHWEGKVVLRAVIRDDGEVIMIDVQESSGRSILDNDAMETLRRASPLKLERPLGKPQVAILMPISYSLR
jgi:protein TonB